MVTRAEAYRAMHHLFLEHLGLMAIETQRLQVLILDAFQECFGLPTVRVMAIDAPILRGLVACCRG